MISSESDILYLLEFLSQVLPDVVKMLIAAGAQTDVTDKWSRTPLHVALLSHSQVRPMIKLTISMFSMFYHCIFKRTSSLLEFFALGPHGIVLEGCETFVEEWCPCE